MKARELAMLERVNPRRAWAMRMNIAREEEAARQEEIKKARLKNLKKARAAKKRRAKKGK
jgi:hypothetical protein